MIELIKEKGKEEENISTAGYEKMKSDISKLIERLKVLEDQAYEAYLPLVNDACNGLKSEKEVEFLLDRMLDFAYNPKILSLYKRVCREYFRIFPSCIVSYVHIYKDLWESDEEPETEAKEK